MAQLIALFKGGFRELKSFCETTCLASLACKLFIRFTCILDKELTQVDL